MAWRAVVAAGRSSACGAGAALISPRTSCNCCCNNMVDEEICSQGGSGRPDVAIVDQEMAGRGLPNGGLFWDWPIKWACKPWTTDRRVVLNKIRIPDRPLRPWSPKNLRLHCRQWFKI